MKINRAFVVWCSLFLSSLYGPLFLRDLWGLLHVQAICTEVWSWFGYRFPIVIDPSNEADKVLMYLWVIYAFASFLVAIFCRFVTEGNANWRNFGRNLYYWHVLPWFGGLFVGVFLWCIFLPLLWRGSNMAFDHYHLYGLRNLAYGWRHQVSPRIDSVKTWFIPNLVRIVDALESFSTRFIISLFRIGTHR